MDSSRQDIPATARTNDAFTRIQATKVLAPSGLSAPISSTVFPQMGHAWPEPDYDTHSHDENGGTSLILGMLLAAFIAWLNRTNVAGTFRENRHIICV